MSENFIKNKVAIFFDKQKRDLSIENNVMGVFLIDVDFFKIVNDAYGHEAGDMDISREKKIDEEILFIDEVR